MLAVRSPKAGADRPSPLQSAGSLRRDTAASSTAFLPEKLPNGSWPGSLVKVCEEVNSFPNPHEATFLKEFIRIGIVFIFSQDAERLTLFPLPLLLQFPAGLGNTPL